MEVRRHVVDRAAQGARLGRRPRRAILARDLEVDELDAAVVAEEDVRGLDVAVDDAVLGRAGKGRRACADDFQHLVGVESEAVAGKALLEGLPLEEFHDDDMDVLGEAAHGAEAAVVADDSRVLRGGQRICAALKAAELPLHVVGVDRHDLERDKLAYFQPGEGRFHDAADEELALRPLGRKVLHDLERAESSLFTARCHLSQAAKSWGMDTFS